MIFSGKVLIYLALCLATLLPAVVQAAPEKPVLVLDSSNDTASLKRFRATDAAPAGANPVGLVALHASGSAEFSAATLGILNQLLMDKTVYVMDLRQESHGFVNGIPVEWLGPHNWANLGKSATQVLSAEQAAVHGLEGQTLSLLPKEMVAEKKTADVKPLQVRVEHAQTEADLVAAEGWSYFRLATADHSRPDDATVDRFIGFIGAMPKDAWLHFHCAGGMGRTTTFMAMYDMMKNSRTVSFDDIVRRQFLLDGEDLTDLPPASNFKYQPKVERLAFLRRFYRYCQDNHDDFKTSWRAWLRSQLEGAKS